MALGLECWIVINVIRCIYDFILVIEPVMYPIYSSTFDKHSAIYTPEVCLSPNYFYEALAFNVSIAGMYSFWSHSGMKTYGYLYHDVFNPFQPTMNRFSSNDYSCGNGRFHTTHRLLPKKTYILVVTTRWVGESGRFSVISYGPTSIQVVHSSRCAFSYTKWYLLFGKQYWDSGLDVLSN
jgi:hypothetical protein